MPLTVKIGEQRMFICGKFIQRLIFYGGWQLEDNEKKQMESFRKFLKDNPKLIMPDNYPEMEILRNLQAAQWNYKKAFHNIIEGLSFRSNLFPLKINDNIVNLVNSGFMYITGRDKCFRPVLIIKPRIITNMHPLPDVNDGIGATSFIIEYVKKYFFLPGQIENWVIIVDFEGMGLNQLPFSTLKTFMSVLQSQYRCTSAKIFLVNVSKGFWILWQTVKFFMEEHTRQKIQTLKEATSDTLKELISSGQLEQRYGGKARNIEPPYWPPRMASGDCEAEESNLIHLEEYENFLEQHPGIQPVGDDVLEIMKNEWLKGFDDGNHQSKEHKHGEEEKKQEYVGWGQHGQRIEDVQETEKESQ